MSDIFTDSAATTGVCAIPIALCTLSKKLLARSWHKELPWIRKLCCGLGYVLLIFVILVCSLVVFSLLPLILWPLLCSSAGRQRFKLIYKTTVVLPFKILWFYHSRCKRQAQEMDFARNKPQPLIPRLRRRLSQAPYCAESQPGASFFTRLPFEIRLQIYKEVIAGDGGHVHVVVHSPMRNPDGGIDPHAFANAMRVGRIRGYRCDHAFDESLFTAPAWHLVNAAESEVVYAGYNVIARTHFSVSFPHSRGRGPVSLVQCCKQIYLEAIDLLYSMQKFSFLSLTPPPFFLQSVLPHRLAQIRSIQICYNHITISTLCANGRNDQRGALHAHRMQKCSVCNLIAWSTMIKQTLTGLRTIEAFIYLGGTFTMPAINAPWIDRLLEMQYGTNGLRELKIRVLPGPWMPSANSPDNFLTNVARFDSLLQDIVKKGAERHTLVKQDIA